jgi:pyruvate/2-oxoglutarate dehydrogenase complex dihydrolipoamide dehydrogenase (E3) component
MGMTEVAVNLAAEGVELNERKFVKVDEYLQTSAPHIFASGDTTGRMMRAAGDTGRSRGRY